MKTIEQQTTTNFNAIDFKDALSMVPLMDALVHDINVINYRKLIRGMQDGYALVSRIVPMRDNEVEPTYKVLTNLGFVSTLEILKEDELIEHFNNSAE